MRTGNRFLKRGLEFRLYTHRLCSRRISVFYQVYATDCSLSPFVEFSNLFSGTKRKMLRFMGGRVQSIVRNTIVPRTAAIGVQNVRASHDGPEENEEDFNKRYTAYLSRPDIDGWEIRQVMTSLNAMDLVPEPIIICAALKACRKVNDYALAIRFLEIVKDKCGTKLNEIYPYILQEIRPTLDELGLNTPEELGYDKPELALQSPYETYG